MSDMPQDEVEDGTYIPTLQIGKEVDDSLRTFQTLYSIQPTTNMVFTVSDVPEHQVAMRFLGYELGFWLYVKMVLQKTNLLEELDRSYTEFKEKK